MSNATKSIIVICFAYAAAFAGTGWLLWGIFGLLFIPKVLWFVGGLFALATVIGYGVSRSISIGSRKQTAAASATWRGPR